MNKIILVGRLTRDPELKYSQNGKAVTKFTLAIDRQFKNQNGQKEADFINCVAFEKRAEVIANYVQKGHKLGVIGRIQTGSYTNQDGQKVYTTDVMVDEIEFLESKSAGGGNTQQDNHQDDNNDDGFVPVDDDDDIPF